LAILIATCGSARSETGAVLVIPGRAGVPIIINGVDASYAVVEGDWGLGKGLHVQPTVYGGHAVEPVPNVGHYYPSSGLKPGYGRLEIEPPAKPGPQRAESFHQSWGSESTPQRAQPVAPLYPPPVIAFPRGGEAGMSPDSGPISVLKPKKSLNSPR